MVYVVGTLQNGSHGTSRDGIEILRSCVAHRRVDSAVVVRRSGEQLEYAGDGPTSSVITPPVVETKVERKGRLVSAPPTLAGPARFEHLPERRFLCGVYGEVPV